MASIPLFKAVLVLCGCVVHGHYFLPESPCPGTFDYKTDGGGVYGLINLRTTEPVESLLIRANFTIAARLPSSYVGRIESLNSNVLSLTSGVPLKYRVVFPVTSPLPRLTVLTGNKDVLCYGPPDIPSPTRYVTKISLMHKLSLDTAALAALASGMLKPPKATQKPPKPDLDSEFLSQLPDDAQIFEITEDGDRQQWKPVSRPDFEQSLHATVAPSHNQPGKKPVTTTTTEPPESTAPPQPAPTSSPSVKPEYIVSSITTSVECGVVAGGNIRQPLIFNGQAYARGEWPWVVAIYKRKDGSLSFICSGTLVSDRHVVTAAHCMQVKTSISSKKDIVVKVGVYNLEDWGDDITVTRTIVSAAIHENYNSSSLANDILVLTFERSVEFNTNIRPACLWSGSPDLSVIVGASGVVAGWGLSEVGPEGKGAPRIVRLPIVSTGTCRASRPDFHKLTSEFTLCAGDRNGVGPCLGDSGGGFFLIEGGRWQLRGIVSLSLRPDDGDSSCNLNEYLVFTDAAKYIDWIRSVIAR